MKTIVDTFEELMKYHEYFYHDAKLLNRNEFMKKKHYEFYKLLRHMWILGHILFITGFVLSLIYVARLIIGI